jgi:hypothetical protein
MFASKTRPLLGATMVLAIGNIPWTHSYFPPIHMGHIQIQAAFSLPNTNKNIIYWGIVHHRWSPIYSMPAAVHFPMRHKFPWNNRWCRGGRVQFYNWRVLPKNNYNGLRRVWPAFPNQIYPKLDRAGQDKMHEWYIICNGLANN